MLQALEDSRAAKLEVRLWALTVLAEIAVRMDNLKAAEQHFKEALSLGSRDVYLMAAYVDLLLDQQRFEEVETLLQEETRIDSLLLRLTLSERELGSAQFLTISKPSRPALRQAGSGVMPCIRARRRVLPCIY